MNVWLVLRVVLAVVEILIRVVSQREQREHGGTDERDERAPEQKHDCIPSDCLEHWT